MPTGRSFEEEALPEKLNLGVWKKIFKYAARRWQLLLVLVVAMLFTSFYDSSFVPSMNYAAYSAVGSLSGVGELASVFDLQLNATILGVSVSMSYLTFIILFAVMILVRAASIFGTFFLMNYVGMLIMVDLRRESFAKIQELSFSYFDKTSSGWLIARMQNDTSSIGDILASGVIQMIWAAFEIAFTLITMFTIDWRLSLLILASIPLIVIIAPAFQKAILTRQRTARNAYSHYVGWLAESIDGAKTIKTLAIEDEVAKEQNEITEDVRAKRMRAGRMNAYFTPTLNLISTTMTVVIIAVGLHFYGTGEWAITPALIITFVGFVSSIYNPLTSVAETISEFMATQAGAEKVMQLLEAKPEIVDSPEVIEKYGDIFNPKKENYEPIQGEIDFVHVDFDYGNGIKVIKDLNLHIEKGTSLAIVGETGSGKTTTVNLLCRFYQPSEGKILIDGANYLDRSLGWLRSNIGYVQQNPFVFTGTFYDNIVYGRHEASMEEVIEACKMVGIHEFIEKQPNGYQTYLADGGNNLSQGQKQLISYARAILRQAPLIILDEATSNVDTETESELQQATAAILKGRTSIIIAHRLSTIVNCDRILVMDHGVVVEDGSHKQLMDKKGHYYELYMNQFRDLSIDSQIKEYNQNIKGKGVKI